jgi:hypothetical protein
MHIFSALHFSSMVCFVIVGIFIVETNLFIFIIYKICLHTGQCILHLYEVHYSQNMWLTNSTHAITCPWRIRFVLDSCW